MKTISWLRFLKRKPTGGKEADPPAEARAEARANPGGYVYVIGGGLGPSDDAPYEAIIGWWKVDDDGNITEPFEKNPKYDPVRFPRQTR